MTDITPKYSVFFEDLTILGIGSYLTSRGFKLTMIKKDLLEHWTSLVKSQSKYSFYGEKSIHSEYFNSISVLAGFFNNLPENPENEEYITLILAEFLKSKDNRLDLGHFKESLEHINLSKKSLDLILTEIKLNSQKPEKPKKKVEDLEAKPNKITKSKVFIVHGHDEGLKQSVARFLERLKLTPLIINELPSGGNTIIEQIESYSDVDFAVVLMTGDDEGRKKREKRFKNRARQNVILELGYFFGKLSRKHVLVIYEKDVEIPSDFLGILHVPYDSAEAWKMRLAKELKESGFGIDLNDVF
jgi:predicted nucleotide-binding protein